DSPPELRKAFEESVDDYLAFCAERGEEPEKPYSGKFLVRIAPNTHRALAELASARKVSLNALAYRFLLDGIAQVKGKKNRRASTTDPGHPAPTKEQKKIISRAKLKQAAKRAARR